MHATGTQSKSELKIIYMLAMNMAALAEPISEYLKQIKNPSGIFRQLPIPDLDDWLNIYRRPSRLKKMCRAILANFEHTQKMVLMGSAIVPFRDRRNGTTL